ncbi:MAG: hypothetical protein II888_01825 [Clostridia bacterium]|nr:hypothetical protein [Clostridia bacterium]
MELTAGRKNQKKNQKRYCVFFQSGLQSVAVLKNLRGKRAMNEETKETQVSWEESHPWLSNLTAAKDEDDSLDEVIRYTLDEMRIA